MAEHYAWQSGATHPMTPLRFYPRGWPNEGQVWHGVIHVFSEADVSIRDDISDSFALVPADWREKWVTYADCPRATNLYTTLDIAGPADVAQFLLDARNHRKDLAVGAGTQQEDPHPPVFGAPPRDLHPPSLSKDSDAHPVDEQSPVTVQPGSRAPDKVAPGEIVFDEADADHDGTVTKQERKRHERKNR